MLNLKKTFFISPDNKTAYNCRHRLQELHHCFGGKPGFEGGFRNLSVCLFLVFFCFFSPCLLLSVHPEMALCSWQGNKIQLQTSSFFLPLFVFWFAFFLFLLPVFTYFLVSLPHPVFFGNCKGLCSVEISLSDACNEIHFLYARLILCVFPVCLMFVMRFISYRQGSFSVCFLCVWCF